MERSVKGGVPKAAEQAMEKLKWCVVFLAPNVVIIMNTSVGRILGEEIKQLKDLANKSLAIRIFDHEEYKSTIQQIFERVNEATTSFQVCALIFILGYVYTHWPFPDRNEYQHPADGKSDTK